MFTQNAATQALSAVGMFASTGHISKHRQFDAQTGKHIPGLCKIGERSCLRKLMRAARRGKIPTERMRVMLQTVQSVAAHLPDYMTGHVRRAAGIFMDPKTLKWVVPQPVRSAVYSVKSNAVRAAVKAGLDRSAVFHIAGGWAFNVPAGAP